MNTNVEDLGDGRIRFNKSGTYSLTFGTITRMITAEAGDIVTFTAIPGSDPRPVTLTGWLLL